MAVAVAVVVTAIVAVPVMIPAMVVRHPAAISLPVAFEEPLAIVMGCNPSCAGVGRPRPISRMPSVMASHWIPVALDPDKTGTGRCRHNRDRSRRRRRTDPHSNRQVDGRRDSGGQ